MRSSRGKGGRGAGEGGGREGRREGGSQGGRERVSKTKNITRKIK